MQDKNQAFEFDDYFDNPDIHKTLHDLQLMSPLFEQEDDRSDVDLSPLISPALHANSLPLNDVELTPLTSPALMPNYEMSSPYYDQDESVGLVSPMMLPTPGMTPHSMRPMAQRQHRSSISNASIIMHKGKPHPLVSPSLMPYPREVARELERQLAQKSNYQAIMDGSAHALGLNYKDGPPVTGMEVKRNTHKQAEQKRRDSLRDCFNSLRVIVFDEKKSDAKKERAASKCAILQQSKKILTLALKYIYHTRQKYEEQFKDFERIKSRVSQLEEFIRKNGLAPENV